MIIRSYFKFSRINFWMKLGFSLVLEVLEEFEAWEWRIIEFNFKVICVEFLL